MQTIAMSPTNRSREVEAMFDTISPRYDLLNRILTFGLDVRWRKGMIRAMDLPSDATVADLACGTGDLCRELMKADLHAIGVDFSAGMLANARTDAPLVQGDIQTIPLATASVDAATCAFALRNVDDISMVFTEMARIVKPSGRIGIMEVSTPSNRLLATGHAFWFQRMVPLIGGLLSDRAAYSYLPRSVSFLPSTPELVSMLESAGFTNVTTKQLGGGAAQWLIGTRQ